MLETGTVHPQIPKSIQLDLGVGLRGADLHAAGRDGDRLLDVSDAHRNVDVGHLTYSDQNILDLRLGEAAGFGGQVVSAWWKKYETIKAVIAGGGAALETCLGADCFDGGVRNCAAITVAHRAADLPAVCLRLRECVAGAENEQEREQQATAG